MHNRAKWVVIDGLEYKKEAAVVYSVEDDLSQIVMIEFIYVINGSTVIFKGECTNIFMLTPYIHYEDSHSITTTNLLFIYHYMCVLHEFYHVKK